MELFREQLDLEKLEEIKKTVDRLIKLNKEQRAAKNRIREMETTITTLKKEHEEMKREYKKLEEKTIKKVESGKKRKTESMCSKSKYYKNKSKELQKKRVISTQQLLMSPKAAVRLPSINCSHSSSRQAAVYQGNHHHKG